MLLCQSVSLRLGVHFAFAFVGVAPDSSMLPRINLLTQLDKDGRFLASVQDNVEISFWRPRNPQVREIPLPPRTKIAFLLAKPNTPLAAICSL